MGIQSQSKLPIPPKEVTCKRCGTEFLVEARGRGRIKYCIECRVDTYDEHHCKPKKKKKKPVILEVENARL